MILRCISVINFCTTLFFFLCFGASRWESWLTKVWTEIGVVLSTFPWPTTGRHSRGHNWLWNLAIQSGYMRRYLKAKATTTICPGRSSGPPMYGAQFTAVPLMSRDRCFVNNSGFTCRKWRWNKPRWGRLLGAILHWNQIWPLKVIRQPGHFCVVLDELTADDKLGAILSSLLGINWKQCAQWLGVSASLFYLTFYKERQRGAMPILARDWQHSGLMRPWWDPGIRGSHMEMMDGWEGGCQLKGRSGGVRVPSVISWWRHQMETFSALLAICAGNSPVTDEFPAQRPVTRSFDVFFDLHPNKWLSKQSWGWWFETPSCHYDVTVICVQSGSKEICAISHSASTGISPLNLIRHLDHVIRGPFSWHGLILIPAWISSI